MSQVLDELASIEVGDDVLQQLDLGGIYRSFSSKYKKLDDLKNFRTEFEKKNWLMRWWHSDKLHDAQLDSAEVQAEFSKTIGQLMMISIMQSKKLSEQQSQLNDQQGKLKAQADGISAHAGKLQEQHQVLAEQSQKLETLVREYFELKGLTEDGAAQLINIAREVKATKDQLLQDFASRARGVEAVCAEVRSCMDSLSVQMDERLRVSDEMAQAALTGIRRDTHEAVDRLEESQRAHQDALQKSLSQGLEALAQSQRAAAAELQSKHAITESRVTDLADRHDQQLADHRERLGAMDVAVDRLSAQSTELVTAIAGANAELAKSVKQQQSHQHTMATFQREVFQSLKRLRRFVVATPIVLMGAVVLAYFAR